MEEEEEDFEEFEDTQNPVGEENRSNKTRSGYRKSRRKSWVKKC